MQKKNYILPEQKVQEDAKFENFSQKCRKDFFPKLVFLQMRKETTSFTDVLGKSHVETINTIHSHT